MTRWRALFSAVLLVLAAVVSVASWVVSHRLAHDHDAGLVQTFYATPDFQNPPLFSGQTSDVSLSFLDANQTLPRRMFSVRWDGYWLVEPGGPMDIYAGADDLVRLYVDERLVIERNPALGLSTIAARLQLERGAHHLRMDYAQYGGAFYLNVQVARAGQSPQPISPRLLFPQPPDSALVRRARLATRLDALEWLTWRLASAALILLVLAPLSIDGVRRLYRSETFRYLANNAARQGAILTEKYGRVCFTITSVLLIVWTAYSRRGGLNPKTLWKDDTWVASLARVGSLWTAMTVPVPAPPGFIGLLWTATRLIHNTTVSLQVVPFICGLVGPLLLGFVVARVGASRALGLVAASLGLLNPPLANYSIFVKQYSLDFCVTAAFLLLAVAILHDRRDHMKSAVGFGVVSALFSLPSIFASAALVHLAALRESLDRSTRVTARRYLLWVVAFDVALGVMFFAWLQGRSGPALERFWIRDFFPVTSPRAAIHFLGEHGKSMLLTALPDGMGLAAWLAPVGMVWLLVRREWRWFGAMVLLLFTGLLAASALWLYPMSWGADGGRTVLFTYAPIIALVVAGVHAVTLRLRFRSAVNTAIAIGASVLVVCAPAPAAYIDVDHADFVRQLEAVARPADAVLLSAGAAYLAGSYAPWRLTPVVERSSPQGFRVTFDRPHTLTLLTHEGNAPTHPDLQAFLVRERPSRLWFFSTRDETLSIEALLAAHQCAERERRSSTVSTLLIEYSCRVPASPVQP